MRLGFLGPMGDDVAAFESGARLLLEGERAERVVYLGDDEGFDGVIEAWARRIVGDEPADVAITRRAAARCVSADSAGIDRFLDAERSRERLRALERLPGPCGKSIEILGGRLAVVAHDKASLDADDILPAAIVLYGRSAEPVLRRVGARTFIAPGKLAAATGVGLLVEADDGSVTVSLFGAAGTARRDETIFAGRAPSPKTGAVSSGT